MAHIEGHASREVAIQRRGQSDTVVDLSGFLTIDHIGLVAQRHSLIEGIEILRLRYRTQ